jgi:PKD repeat protein
MSAIRSFDCQTKATLMKNAFQTTNSSSRVAKTKASPAWRAPLILLSLILASHASAAGITHYVNVNNPVPAAPYTSWATAATNIQDAVDAAASGDEVVVSNGIYQAGGRVVYGSLTNRVAVTNLLVLRSVNGPKATTIAGYQVPGTTNGDGAIRCVYLTNGAVLSGFTLTNGATRTGGDEGQEQSGGGVWCESAESVVTNCTLSGNWAVLAGGGAYGGTLNNCTLTGNSADQGGYGNGGGACYGTLNNCAFSGNSAFEGGGAYESTLNNCALTSNSAWEEGGGAYESTLNNCMLNGNSAWYAGGGGACGGTLNNCTLSGNWASYLGGGAFWSTLNNCILYYNHAPDCSNYLGGYLSHCCSTPLPPGKGNIEDAPQLVDFAHISSKSPCIGKGIFPAVTGMDIDGEAWSNPPSIGCDEYHRGSITGVVTVAILASFTNAATGFRVPFEERISGRVSATRWDFGDGSVVTNQVSVSHAWTAAGDYAVTLTAFNQSHPDGVSAAVTVHVSNQPVHYVDINNAAPVAPYLSWATAATNIQDAVDAASVLGALVVVSNGVYQTGGRVVYGSMTNRVAVTKPLVLRSVNGPEATTIVGYQVLGTMYGDGAVRCVYLTNGAILSGFTLTNGATRTAGDDFQEQSGGGVWCESQESVVTNCTLNGNWATYYGGGAYGGTLNNCTLSGNSAGSGGGGAYLGTLNNCVLSGNSITVEYGGEGGGACGGTLNNCTLSGNSVKGYGGDGGGTLGSTLTNCISYYNVPNNYDGDTLSYCCTTPMPQPQENGNITNEPLFVNLAAGDFHLQANSPCINAGLNSAAPTGTDLDGNPRIIGGTVDMGAYEFGGVKGWIDSPLGDVQIIQGDTLRFSGQGENEFSSEPVDFHWDFGDGRSSELASPGC